MTLFLCPVVNGVLLNHLFFPLKRKAHSAWAIGRIVCHFDFVAPMKDGYIREKPSQMRSAFHLDARAIWLFDRQCGFFLAICHDEVPCDDEGE